MGIRTLLFAAVFLFLLRRRAVYAPTWAVGIHSPLHHRTRGAVVGGSASAARHPLFFGARGHGRSSGSRSIRESCDMDPSCLRSRRNCFWVRWLLWLLRAVSEPTASYTVVDHPSLKLTKVAIFCLMLTHVVTDGKSLKILLWTLVLSTFILGIEAYTAPRWMFDGGRLEGIAALTSVKPTSFPHSSEACCP